MLEMKNSLAQSVQVRPILLHPLGKALQLLPLLLNAFISFNSCGHAMHCPKAECTCCITASTETRGDIRAAGGALAEFDTALQVPELIESKCGSRALPSWVWRIGGELFISLLFPACFEFSRFE